MHACLIAYRWLLLGFQREFEHSDALRLFEILSCDHLELISQQVDRARYQERLARKHSTGDSQSSSWQNKLDNNDFSYIYIVIYLDDVDVHRGQFTVRAAGHQHWLHLWALHLCSHSVRQQRVSAAVPRWCTAYPVYKQVCLYAATYKSLCICESVWMCH